MELLKQVAQEMPEEERSAASETERTARVAAVAIATLLKGCTTSATANLHPRHRDG